MKYKLLQWAMKNDKVDFKNWCCYIFLLNIPTKIMQVRLD